MPTEQTSQLISDANTAHEEANNVQAVADRIDKAGVAGPRKETYDWVSDKATSDPEGFKAEVEQAKAEVTQMRESSMGKMRAIQGESFNASQEEEKFKKDPERYVLSASYYEARDHLAKALGSPEAASTLLAKVEKNGNERYSTKERHERIHPASEEGERVDAAAGAVAELVDPTRIKSPLKSEFIGDLLAAAVTKARMEAHDSKVWRLQMDNEEENRRRANQRELTDSVPGLGFANSARSFFESAIRRGAASAKIPAKV